MTCPACDGNRTELFHEQEGVPVHSCLLVENATSARNFPRGRLSITLCRDCGFMFNADYNAADSHYSSAYEETQGFSPHFQEFLAGLADRWVGRYGLAGSRVVEIGCGKGEFLVELARHGVAEAIGIDPGLHPDRIPEDVRDRIRPITGFFPADMDHLDADAVVCRHTLEHIGPVADFMHEVRRAIGDRQDTVVLFELPDTLRVLREAAFWDLYYEHCSYFTLGSLGRLFRRTGFEVLDLSTTYDDQYLLVEARCASSEAAEPHPLERDLASVVEAVAGFRIMEAETVTGWSERIAKVAAHGGRTALWGSGSKAVAFLAALGEEADSVGAVVDINPHKHGKFMAGTGHRIESPSYLTTFDPELVIAMNPVYVEEIQRDLDELDVATTLEAL